MDQEFLTDKRGTVMLLLSGTAEIKTSNKWLTKGNRHEFYMFSKNADLLSQLENIESYFVARGLDNIEIQNSEELSGSDEINNDMLMYAYQEAEQKGLAGTIVSVPVAA
ncbi:MAG: hypothetical protein CL811_00380 [Colwelliaceae bacterium]|nr:hypothetical protein [Colwelliaceae bacterium]